MITGSGAELTDGVSEGGVGWGGGGRRRKSGGDAVDADLAAGAVPCERGIGLRKPTRAVPQQGASTPPHLVPRRW